MKKIYVDIDNTICKTSGTNYEKSIPIKERIEKINFLYDSGYEIIYWIDRGVDSNEDFLHLSIKQLEEWGCKFHKIKTLKPKYFLSVSEKNINSETFFSEDNKIFNFLVN